MTVGSILGQKGRNVVTVPPGVPILGAAKILSENGIGSLVVVGKNMDIVGILSERDIVRSLALKGPSVLHDAVSTCMTEEVVTCSSRDSIDQIMKIMSSKRFRHVPVVEDGELMGIISIGDVVKTKIASAEKDVEAMREYIGAAG